MRTIGILGGGQLGMMLAESIFTHGGDVVIYDPDADAPACRAARKSMNRSWTDKISLRSFFDMCDAVTFEFENVESAPLFAMEKIRPILPGVSVLHTTQDRILEKTFLKENGLPHAGFVTARTVKQLKLEVRKMALPIVLKTARGGYDGKGQFLIKTKTELLNLLEDPDLIFYEGSGFVAESLIDIHMEVSCIVARSPIGESFVYPCFENMHRDHVLDFTVFPARIPLDLAEKIQDIALRTAEKLDVFGLLCVEFFLTKSKSEKSPGEQFGDWHIYINELAPRPHNSGHVTRAACTLSQFDALARILLSLPLTQARGIESGAYCMGNLLGDVWLAQGSNGKTDLNLSSLKHFPEIVDIVIYGKKEARAKRKMGHFVAKGPNADEALAGAQKFRESLAPHAVRTDDSGKR